MTKVDFFVAVCALILPFVDIGFVFGADDNPITSKIDPFPQTFPRMYRLAKETAELFPADMPANEWLTFEAAGFSKPVTGVIYRDGSAERGVPLGGLATGFIALGTDGTFDYYSTIFSAWLERYRETVEYMERQGSWPGAGPGAREQTPSMRLPFLGVTVAGETYLLSLLDVEGVERAKQIHYWGHYPVADLEYEIPSPVSVSLRAWTPFLPGDAVNSNTPGSVFQVTLRNESDQAQPVTLGFSFHGPRHEELAANAFGVKVVKERPMGSSSPVYRRQEVKGEFTGVTVDTTWEGFPYSYALGVIGNAKVRTGGELTGKAWNNLADRLPDSVPADSGATVATDFVVGPNETRTVYYVLGWYAPNWNSMTTPGARDLGGDILNEYINMYGSRFKNAQEVARLLAGDHALLLKRILSWQEVVYSENKMPGWLQDSLINCLSLMPQVYFWMKSPDPKHWWGEKGMFVGCETLLACPLQSCLGGEWIGQWPVDVFFPELAITKLSAFKHYQKPNGQVPSTLGPGTEPDRPWYDQQLSLDGQYYVQMVDRYWQVTEDDAAMAEFYPSVKAQIRFMKSEVDRDQDGVPDVIPGHAGFTSSQYYDGWKEMKGTAIHVATYWLSTLRMTERMAVKMGDSAFAEDCRSSFARASQSIEEKLWNPAVGSYFIWNEPGTGNQMDLVLSDQLAGEYLARLHGFDGVLPEDRVKTVLDTIWKLNVGPYGVRISIRPDGTFNGIFGAYGTVVILSYSSVIPSGVMVYTGNKDRGLEVMRRPWERQACHLKMPWDQIWGIYADSGAYCSGLEYDHNTMLWAFGATAVGEDLKTFCSPRGLVGRMIRAAKGKDAPLPIPNAIKDAMTGNRL